MCCDETGDLGIRQYLGRYWEVRCKMYSYMYYYLYSDMYNYLRQHIVGGSISIIHNILVLPLCRTCLTSPPGMTITLRGVPAGKLSREFVTSSLPPPSPELPLNDNNNQFTP